MGLKLALRACPGKLWAGAVMSQPAFPLTQTRQTDTTNKV